MRSLLLSLVLSTLAIWCVAQIVPGFNVDSAGAAFIAAVLIGLVNATLGFALKVVTFPLSILTFGLFMLIINAAMIQLVAYLMSGFHVDGFLSAFLGAIVLTIISTALRSLVKAAQ